MMRETSRSGGPVADRGLTIVVPAFNEVRHIQKTLVVVTEAAERLLDDYEIIVVDDGSSDGTGDVAEHFASEHPKVRVKQQITNQGVGAAYCYGLTEARFPFLSLIPGDNVFTSAAVENVFAVVGAAPLIVSYRNNTDVRTFQRRILSTLCTLSMRAITGRRIRDAHSMYVFPVDLARTIVPQPGYGYHIESLGRLLCLVSGYKEVPAPLNPRPDANSGVMKVHVVSLLAMTMLRLSAWRIRMLLRQATARVAVTAPSVSQRSSKVR